MGKINVSTTMWSWQKKLTDQASSTITAVTALSVDPSGTKLACHGMDWQFTDAPTQPGTTIGFVFVLDVKNGAMVSGLLKMTHLLNQVVQSKGFSLHDSGQVFIAIG